MNTNNFNNHLLAVNKCGKCPIHLLDRWPLKLEFYYESFCSYLAFFLLPTSNSFFACRGFQGHLLNKYTKLVWKLVSSNTYNFNKNLYTVGIIYLSQLILFSNRRWFYVCLNWYTDHFLQKSSEIKQSSINFTYNTETITSTSVKFCI